jgi:hypothetical protein
VLRKADFDDPVTLLRRKGELSRFAVRDLSCKNVFHQNVCFDKSTKRTYNREVPYELPLPNEFKRWKVKIFDNELLFEQPHVTIIFKEERWRLGLRSRTFLDQDPEPRKVRKEVMDEIWANFDTLCEEWDARFPTNPVSHADNEDEEE